MLSAFVVALGVRLGVDKFVERFAESRLAVVHPAHAELWAWLGLVWFPDGLSPYSGLVAWGAVLRLAGPKVPALALLRASSVLRWVG